MAENLSKVSHRLLDHDVDEVCEEEGDHRVGDDRAEHVVHREGGRLADGEEAVSGDDDTGDVETVG